jgi:hypothetical protein
MHKHYVILCDWAVDSMSDRGINIIAVTHTFEEAVAIFVEKVAEEKKYAEDNGWEIFSDTGVEFDAGVEGYYAAEHTRLYIQIVEN